MWNIGNVRFTFSIVLLSSCVVSIAENGQFSAECFESHPPHSDATRELVENILSANVSYPRASDVLHPTARHPHLQRERKRCTVTWTDVLRTVYHWVWM